MRRPHNTSSQSPPKKKEKAVVSDVMVSYVAGSAAYPYLLTDRILPRHVDDVETDYNLTVYDQMYNDPMLGGHLDKMKIAVLELGWTMVNPVPQPTAKARKDAGKQADVANYEAATEITEFVEWNFKRILYSQRRSFTEICWDLLDAMKYGNRIAEWTLEPCKFGEYAGSDCLKAIRVKPRDNFAFILNSFNELRGIMARVPGKGFPIREGIVADAKDLPNAIDPDKFVILTISAKEDDPRGTSQFRKAYAPWYEKQKLRVERLKHGVQMGGGLNTLEISAETPNNVSYTDKDGKVTQVPIMEAANRALSQLSSGNAAAFPPGCKFTRQPPAGDGKALGEAIADCNREMVMALQKQLRETMESQHGSRADSQTGQDVGDKVTNWLRGMLADAFEPLIKILVTLKFGEDAAEDFLPSIDFTRSATGDFNERAQSLSSLGYTLHKSQFEAIDLDNDMPEREDGWDVEPEPEKVEPKVKKNENP
jgi:hypothetical protein